jgi:peptide/nickel transport system permease protein
LLTAEPPDRMNPGDPGYADSSVEVVRARWERLRTFSGNRLAVVGVCIVVFLILFCFVGPLVYHTNQVSTNLREVNLSPRAKHLLGTDNAGFDILGRLMSGGQTTLVVGIGAATVATTVGAIWGALAGLIGGWIDGIMMRIVDTIMALPVLLLLLFLASVLQPNVGVLILVIGSVAWLAPARLVRAEVLALRTSPFVEAARGVGVGRVGLLMRHLLPNAFSVIIVNGTFQVADAVLAVASLSFLGLGVPPPAANWGGMIATGVNYLFAGYWWEVWPAGVCLVSLVIAVNFIGDGLRDVGDARLTRR